LTDIHEPGTDSFMRAELSRIIESDGNSEQLLQDICDFLYENMENCDWAGFYLVDPSIDDELFLGPFAGEPTEHVRIEFGTGICGQAASTEKTFIITDVGSESNYLSCSAKVKSEIVVPVFHMGAVIGEIDLDSHVHDGFSDENRILLEWLARRTSELTEIIRQRAAES